MTDVGEMLREARHRRSWSLSDVTDATHIKLSYLEALENGDYSLLPGPAYITGFLRNYARHLGLHPDDVVQQYYLERPAPQPAVKAATRVLASGQERHNRKRLFWTLSTVAAFLVGGYAVKQYAQDSAAHAYSPPLNVTPANLGSGAGHAPPATARSTIHVRLHALAPVWVSVTVDGTRHFRGIMRPRSGVHSWKGHQTIYVVTYDGMNLRASYDGHPATRVARQPGLTIKVATPAGWQTAS